MPNVFNVAEVMDMGISKERKRREFYSFTAENFKEQDMKELFTNLAKWEDAHIIKFTEIRKSVEGDEVSESYQGEFEAYMRALVDDMFYSQVSREWFVKNVKSPKEAIKYGIGFERDAILFFSELLKYMEGGNKDKVNILIEEERKHLLYLSELNKKYK